MQWKALTLAMLAERVLGQAGRMPMMRFQCSQLVIDRLDPLVEPGAIPSAHLHQIVGGNAFNASMDPADVDLPSAATCTSCTFSEDLSNYWTAVMFHRSANGTFTRVSQFPNMGLDGNGGITVYYIAGTDAASKVTAFKPGFRMVTGDAGRRGPGGGSSRKVCHRCMPKSGDNSNLNCAAPDSEEFPSAPCVGGIRTIITFPTCWNGKDTDSPDHKSHVAYSDLGGSIDVGSNGGCPDTHPVRIPQLMLEIMWDTRPFDQDWPEDGSQPFVWSTGDTEGYSQHGDYVFGWKDDSLQRAMDNRCDNNKCEGVLEYQPTEEAVKCTLPQTVEEATEGGKSHNFMNFKLGDASFFGLANK